MIEQVINPFYQKYLLKPIAGCVPLKLSANQLTLTAGIMGVLVWPALLFSHSMLAIILLLLSGFLDSLDGYVARLRNQSSDFGCVLDIMSDRVVECAVVIGLYCIDPGPRALPCLLMLVSILLCVTSFLVVGALKPNLGKKSFFISHGLMERAEAFVFFVAMILWPSQFNWLAYVFISLVILTAFLRIFDFSRDL